MPETVDDFSQVEAGEKFADKVAISDIKDVKVFDTSGNCVFTMTLSE